MTYFRMAAAFILALSSCARVDEDSESYPSSIEPAGSSDVSLPDMRAAAMELGSTLKQRLTAALQNEGPVSAIAVCAEEAPKIADEILARTGIEVGRTSMRVRNTANAPDAWEAAQLESFATKLAAGEDAAAMEAWAIISEDGLKKARWMKPIMTEGLCLICHGEVIAPELQSAINARYPGDAATGFQLGELRGAFTIAKTLSDN